MRHLTELLDADLPRAIMREQLAGLPLSELLRDLPAKNSYGKLEITPTVSTVALILELLPNDVRAVAVLAARTTSVDAKLLLLRDPRKEVQRAACCKTVVGAAVACATDGDLVPLVHLLRAITPGKLSDMLARAGVSHAQAVTIAEHLVAHAPDVLVVWLDNLSVAYDHDETVDDVATAWRRAASLPALPACARMLDVLSHSWAAAVQRAHDRQLLSDAQLDAHVAAIADLVTGSDGGMGSRSDHYSGMQRIALAVIEQRDPDPDLSPFVALAAPLYAYHAYATRVASALRRYADLPSVPVYDGNVASGHEAELQAGRATSNVYTDSLTARAASVLATPVSTTGDLQTLTEVRRAIIDAMRTPLTWPVGADPQQLLDNLATHGATVDVSSHARLVAALRSCDAVTIREVCATHMTLVVEVPDLAQLARDAAVAMLAGRAPDLLPLLASRLLVGDRDVLWTAVHEGLHAAVASTALTGVSEDLSRAVATYCAPLPAHVLSSRAIDQKREFAAHVATLRVPALTWACRRALPFDTPAPALEDLISHMLATPETHAIVSQCDTSGAIDYTLRALTAPPDFGAQWNGDTLMHQMFTRLLERAGRGPHGGDVVARMLELAGDWPGSLAQLYTTARALCVPIAA